MTQTTEQAHITKLLITGGIANLNEAQRLDYYSQLCADLGLNPYTQPFQYLQLSGKLVLYATKSCTEQLRQLHGVSITSITSAQVGDVYVVTASAEDRKGRTDYATGAVSIAGLKSEALSNALMKAETKAKRRVTLSLCSLGMLDETEVDAIPGAQRMPNLMAKGNGAVGTVLAAETGEQGLAPAISQSAAQGRTEPSSTPAVSSQPAYPRDDSGDYPITDPRGLCNWAMDNYPDIYDTDESVKVVLRANNVKTWGPRTDVKALQLMLSKAAVATVDDRS